MRVVKSWLSLSTAMRSMTVAQCFIALSSLVVCASICCTGTSFWSPGLSENPWSSAQLHVVTKKAVDMLVTTRTFHRRLYRCLQHTDNSTQSQKRARYVGANCVELPTDYWLGDVGVYILELRDHRFLRLAVTERFNVSLLAAPLKPSQ